MSTRPHLRLAADCTLREADDLHFSLLGADPAAEPFCIDGSAVAHCDTAGLQLLVSFVRARLASGRHVSWTGVSAELQRCASRLGLVPELQLPGAVPAGET